MLVTMGFANLKDVIGTKGDRVGWCPFCKKGVGGIDLDFMAWIGIQVLWGMLLGLEIDVGTP